MALFLTPVLKVRTDMPLYQQLYQHIKAEIIAGHLVAEQKLPSKRRLAEHLDVSQNTVKGAYEQLLEEGYISSKERSGYFVQEIRNLVQVPKVAEHIEEPGTEKPQWIVDFGYHGVDLEHFPFLILRKLAKDILGQRDPAFLRRVDPQGYKPLRDAIASYLHNARGVHCNPEQIVISSGTEFLFSILFQVLPDHFLYGIEDPGQDRLPLLFRRNRAQWVPMAMDVDGMRTDSVRESGVDVLCITPAHQFPSGTIMSVGRRTELLEWAGQKPSRYLVEDDYDGEFKYGGVPVPALQSLDGHERVVYMGTFSKALTPSLRISYMVLPEHLLRLYRRTLSYLICPVPLLDQMLLYRFIQDGYFERHLNQMRTIYRRKREALVKGLRNLSGAIHVQGAEAGLHLVLKVNNGMTEGQLIAAAQACGVKVYGMSAYRIQSSESPIPEILIGYASVTLSDVEKGVGLLAEAWFGGAT